MTLPKVAIIILIHNGEKYGEKYIEKCLGAVFASDYKGPMELVVVDNASTDKSWQVAHDRFRLEQKLVQRYESPVVITIAQNQAHPMSLDDKRLRNQRGENRSFQIFRLNTNRGWAGGNNYGIMKASKQVAKWPKYEYEGGDWDLALLLNDDTEIRPDMISELVKAYHMGEHPACPFSDNGKTWKRVHGQLPTGIFGCTLLYPDDETVQHDGGVIGPTGHTKHAGHGQKRADLQMRSFYPDYITGAAMMITRKCWDAMGPFYEGYGMYYEEVEFCVRARNKGFETVCVPSAIAVHHADQRKGRSKYVFHLRYERSRLRFVWRNWSLKQLWRWLFAERRWYRKHIKGNRTEHADATRKAYIQMWCRAPWIMITRKSK